MILEYKDFLIKPHKEHPTSLIVVTAGKGGKIPAVLDSLYTSFGVAKYEIDKYLETKPKKEVKHAEAGTTG